MNALTRRLATGLLAAAAATPAEPARGDVKLENDHVRWTVSADTMRQSFVLKATGKDLAKGTWPLSLASLHDGRGWHASRAVEAVGGTWRVRFADDAGQITLRAAAEADHFRIELAKPVPKAADHVVFAQLRLSVPAETLGHFWPVVRAGDRHVLLAALSPFVRTTGFASKGVVFRAEAFASTGFDDVRVAVLAAPAPRTLDAVERLELTYRLPHLTLGGKWFRHADELRRPYLFTDLTEANADRAIELARRGGFGYVMTFSGVWSTSCGHYLPNRGNYPRGLAGLKAVADKLHAAGLKLGIHLLSACISQGDPYVRPVPDRRLAVARTFALAADVPAQAAEIPVGSSPAGMTKVDSYGTAGCDLWIDDEIIRYGGYTTAAPFRFTGCRRGACGTRPAAHKAAAKVRYLHRMYNMYLPDPKSDLLPEIAARIADVCNRCGVDMIYFDGGEAMARLGRGWHDTHWIHREVARRLRREVLITGSGGNGGFGWHVHMRGNANDGVCLRTKRYLDEHKVPQRVAVYRRNLAAAEMGWLNMRAHSPAYPATQPDEWEYFCAKALAHDAPVSLHMHTGFFDRNGRAGECLDIIRRWEHARREAKLSETLLAQLREPGREFRLVGDAAGGWRFRRMQFGPTRLVEPDDGGAKATLRVTNPFAAQRLSVRIRPRPALKPFGSPDNVVLLDPAEKVAWQAGSTGDARCTAAISRQVKPPGGAASLKLTAQADQATARAWVGREFAKRPNLLAHRSLALYVHGDGSGALLDVQLVDPSLIRARDYLVPIDFAGWRLVRLVDADFDAAFRHRLWRHKGNLGGFSFNAVRELRLQLTGMTKGKPAVVHVGRVEALREVPTPLLRPTVEVGGRSVRLPLTLQPDQTAELQPDGTVTLYGPNNNARQTAKLPAAPPVLRPGDNTLTLRADGKLPPVYLTPILRGPELPPAAKTGEPR